MALAFLLGCHLQRLVAQGTDYIVKARPDGWIRDLELRGCPVKLAVATQEQLHEVKLFRRELLERLSALIQDERKSVLFSSHITSDLERIADYITFIRAGEIVFSDRKDELLESWAVVKGGVELLSEELRPLFRRIRRGAHGVEALTHDAREARRVLDSSCVIERASLEDIMVLMEKGDGDD